MLFLFGLRSKAKVIGQIERSCSKCAKPTVQSAIETQRWFTVFFIPLIPIGSSYAIRCNLCGLTVKGSEDVKKQLAAPKAMAARA